MQIVHINRVFSSKPTKIEIETEFLQFLIKVHNCISFTGRNERKYGTGL